MATASACSLKEVDASLHDLSVALSRYGGEQANLVAKNPKLLKSMFDMLVAVQKADPLAGVSAAASGASAGAKAAGATQRVRSHTQQASAVVSIFKASMGLANVGKYSGAAAVGTFVGAITLQKTGIALTLAGGDNQRALCVGAVMELAGSAAVTAITAPTGVLLWLSLSSLAASSWNAGTACSNASWR